MTRLVLLLVAACIGTPVQAGPARADATRDRVRAYRRSHEHEILSAFLELLAIPNVAADRASLRRNADHIVAMLAARGIAAQLLEVDGAPPAVYADLGAPARKPAKTLLLYAHYDGQPVDPSEWTGAPFQPVLRAGGREVALPASGQAIDPEARVFARSASDDKAGVMGIIVALEALKASGIPPSVHVKVLFEGEEEAMSGHLRAILEKNAALLATDGVLFIDGPAHPNGQPTAGLGVRGFLSLELTVYGPNRALHSGHYGNWAPNPIVLLSHLVDSMRDADGTILVAGIREAVRPLTANETKLLTALPDPDAGLRRELGLAWSEGQGASLAQRILQPALNLRGIAGGHVGDGAANAIPTQARASIDFRLVPDLTPELVRTSVENHIASQGFYIVHDEPDAATRLEHARIVKVSWGDGYPATRTPVDAPLVRAFLETLHAANAPIVVTPSAGASLPTHMFAEVLRAPLVFLSTANHDNNQHAANENLRIQNLWDGIELYAITLAGIGHRW